MLYNNKATDQKRPRPNCDMCPNDNKAVVDGKTRMGGTWAYMCIVHFSEVGIGLGLGLGQVLLCDDELDAPLRARYNLEAESARGGGS